MSITAPPTRITVLSCLRNSVVSVLKRSYKPLPLVTVLMLALPTASRAMVVVSLTFDDCFDDQLTAQPILTAHGMPATFYIISGRVGESGHMTWSDITGLQNAGNEIGGHTVDHPHLTTLSASDQTHEICDDRTALIGQGFPVISFAYPFGDANATTESIAKGCGYLSARDIGGVVNPTSCSGCPYGDTIPPGDPYLIRSYDSIKSTTTIADMANAVTGAEIHGGQWLVFVFHHVCDDCDLDSVNQQLLDAFLTWLKPRASIGTIIRTMGQVMQGDLPNPPPQLPPPPPAANLLQNPSLEIDANKDDVPDCWKGTGFRNQHGHIYEN